MEFRQRIYKPAKHDEAHFISRIFFCWAIPLFRLGNHGKIDFHHLFKCSKQDDVVRNSAKLRSKWRTEALKSRPSLARAIIKAFGCRYLFYTLLIGGFEECVVRILQPFFLGVVIDYFARRNPNILLTITSMFLFCLCSISYAITHHPYVVNNARQGLRVRAAVQHLIMEKVYYISKSTLHSSEVSNIITLMANDVNKFDECSFFLCTLIITPIQATIVFYILWKTLDMASLAGIAVLSLIVPTQICVGHQFGRVRRYLTHFTDQRITLLNEIFHGIKTIKTLAWESVFIDKISAYRKSEIDQVKRACRLRAVNLAFSFVTTRVILFACFIAFLKLGNELTAKRVFVTKALFDTIKVTLTTNFPNAFSTVCETLVSCRRIQNFLLLDDGYLDINTSIQSLTSTSPKVEVKNMCVFWDTREKEPCLTNITFTLQPGDLMTVIGSFGGGKSSLLLAMLGEIPSKAEKFVISGKISYVSQEAWAYHGTIKENILFGEAMDGERYKQVLYASCLDKDLAIWPAKDTTLVGERGYTLSGGQRARICIARALYRKADIYLFDEPFAALDAKVKNQLFARCHRFLKEKISIIVTNEISFVREANKILVIREGKGYSYQNFSQLLESSVDKLYIHHALKKSQASSSVTSTSKIARGSKFDTRVMSSLRNRSGSSAGSSIGFEGEVPATEEAPVAIEDDKKAQSKSVPLEVYCAYLRGGFSCTLFIVVVFFNLVSQFLFHYNDIWLAEWTNSLTQKEESQNNSRQAIVLSRRFVSFESLATDDQERIQVYTLLIVSLFVTSFIRSISFLSLCNRASVALHNFAFNRIIRAPMIVFEETPIGRLLNRFSRDISVVDEQLPYTGFDQILNISTIIGVMIVISLASWYLIFPAITLLTMVYFLRKYYIGTGRNMKKLEAKTRAPLFSHIASCMDGLSTIRALRMQQFFMKTFGLLLNDTIAVKYVSLVCARSLGIWADWMCIIYIIITTCVLAIFRDYVPPGNAGAALSQIIMLTGMFQWATRQSAEFENQMVSVERLYNFKDYPIEVENTKTVKPPDKWPSEGVIEFINVTVQYPSSPKPSLYSLNFKVKSCEKIGIIGRTGCGKTTLLSSIFRLIEPMGLITIDGINIQSISMEDLRDKISYIPQDPILFSGTLRWNMDPYDVHTDDEIWDALESVTLKEKLISHKHNLNFLLREGAENISAGEKQLLCLARALLNEHKIIVIDEATANMDYNTDELIQKTIKTRFAPCTVLTNAHRLETIIDSDRVMVLDRGKIAEFDQPYKLLQKNHLFAHLVDQTGHRQAAKLKEMAKKHHDEVAERYSSSKDSG